MWAAKVRADVKDDAANEEESAAGTFLEPFILQRFGARYSVHVVPTPKQTYHRRSAPFLAANPDGLVYRAPKSLGRPLGLVDAKTRSPFQRGLWGAAGSADVPPDELCQVQWYMEILDLPVAYLAVFFDRGLVVFVVHRDRELGALMVEEATAFWNDYVVPKKEPPFEGVAASDYLRRKFPHVTDPMRDSELDDDLLVARYDLILRHMAVLKDRLDLVQNQLRARIGPASGIAGQGYVARWYETKPKVKTDLRAVVNELRSFPLVEDEETARIIRDQIDRAIVKHTTVGDASRTLKVFFKGPRALPDVELEPITASALPRALPAAEGEPE